VHCGEERGGAMGEGVELGPAASFSPAPSLLLAWGREAKRRERKEKKGREKGKGKNRNIFQIWKFPWRKIKDNLWDWSKNYFCKRNK
jgi:hypothetical protein